MISARSLSVSFGRRAVLHDGTFEVPASRIAIFIGANGSGKTTTLRALTGLIPVSGAHNSLDGHERQQRLGVSLGPDSIPRSLTVRAFLRLTTRPGLIDDAPDLLTSTGLDRSSRQRIGRLSTGTRQKLSVIAAIRHRPDALVLDEPHNALDPESIEWLHAELRAARARGAAILISSHLLREVAQVADLAFEIRDGFVAQIPWPPERMVEPVDAIRVESAEAERLRTLLAAEGHAATAVGPSLLSTNASARIVLAISNQAGITLSDLHVTPAPTTGCRE